MQTGGRGMGDGVVFLLKGQSFFFEYYKKTPSRVTEILHCSPLVAAYCLLFVHVGAMLTSRTVATNRQRAAVNIVNK